MGLPGSQRAVQLLVDEHYQALYRFAYRLAGTAADAEDLTQEAFCRAQFCLSQLREQNNARPWLFRILRNLYLHRLREDRTHRLVSVDDIGDLPERPTDHPLPIDSVELQRALNELPEAFRTPIILFYFEEFSYRDIAEQMDVPMGTVMSRLARAKAYLRARLVREAEPVAVVQRGTSNGM